MESQEHADSWATLSVHALSRAWTDTCENPILQGEALLFSPLYSGFSRGSREKHLAFQVSLYRTGLSHNVICPFFIVPQNLKICDTMAEEVFLTRIFKDFLSEADRRDHGR